MHTVRGHGITARAAASSCLPLMPFCDSRFFQYRLLCFPREVLKAAVPAVCQSSGYGAKHLLPLLVLSEHRDSGRSAPTLTAQLSIRSFRFKTSVSKKGESSFPESTVWSAQRLLHGPDRLNYETSLILRNHIYRAHIRLVLERARRL